MCFIIFIILSFVPLIHASLDRSFSHPLDAHRSNHDQKASQIAPSLADEFQQIRFRFHILSLRQSIPSEYDATLAVMKRVATFFNSLLRVYRYDTCLTSGGLSSIGSCIPIPDLASNIPQSHLCNGNATKLKFDFMLYVTISNTDCSDKNVIAYAQHCITIQNHNRPFVGYTNICLHSWAGGKPCYEFMYKTLLHEVMHTIVFAKGLFGYYVTKEDRLKQIDPGGYGMYTKFINMKTLPWKFYKGTQDHKAYFIDLPHLRTALEEYSSCKNLPGVELESEGGSGTAETHFDKRVFGPEIMTGIINGRAYFSQFSVAILRDSGWYEVNESAKVDGKFLVERLENGWFSNKHGLGCEFFNTSCTSFIQARLSHNQTTFPFCNADEYLSLVEYRKDELKNRRVDVCSPDHTAYLTCGFIMKKKKVDSLQRFRYFSNRDAIGKTQIASYCPIRVAASYSLSHSHKTGDANCQNVHNTIKGHNFLAESYGEENICLHTGMPGTNEQFVHFQCHFGNMVNLPHFSSTTGAGCYQKLCSNGRLHIKPAGKNRWLTCYGEETRLRISRYEINDRNGAKTLTRGILFCPSCRKVCETSEDPTFKCLPDLPDITVADLLSACHASTSYSSFLLTLFVILFNRLVT